MLDTEKQSLLHHNGTIGGTEMALINCRECGKQISDSAKQCPHCGCGTQFGKNVAQAQGLNVALLIGCVAGLIGMFLFWSGLMPMQEGIADYGSLFRWLDRDDEAGGIFVKVCFGLGMTIGSVVISLKVRREAKWQAQRMAAKHPTVPIPNTPDMRIPDELFDGAEEDVPFHAKREKSVPNGWKCSCGRTNAIYVSTCACGKNKHDI